MRYTKVKVTENHLCYIAVNICVLYKMLTQIYNTRYILKFLEINMRRLIQSLQKRIQIVNAAPWKLLLSSNKCNISYINFGNNSTPTKLTIKMIVPRYK